MILVVDLDELLFSVRQNRYIYSRTRISRVQFYPTFNENDWKFPPTYRLTAIRFELVPNAFTIVCDIRAIVVSFQYEKAQLEKVNVEVRLQWDPDHGANGSTERRRAIQLGLKKEVR